MLYEKELEYEKLIAARMGLEQNEHFFEELYQEAVGGMVNEDGSKGPHYDIDKVKKIIEDHDIELGEYNVYDFAYCLNMVWSDYKGAIPDNEKSYVDVAKAFIFDEDGPKGKPVKYYLAMKYGVQQ